MTRRRGGGGAGRPRGWQWLVVLLLVVVALFTIIRDAPFYLPDLPAATAAAAAPEGPQQVFGYATLTNPVVRLVVIGRLTPSEPAVLAGYTRSGRDLVQAPEGRVAGRVFSVTPEGLHRLDRYERLGIRYRRDLMALKDGAQAWVYRLRE